MVADHLVLSSSISFSSTAKRESICTAGVPFSKVPYGAISLANGALQSISGCEGLKASLVKIVSGRGFFLMHGIIPAGEV